MPCPAAYVTGARRCANVVTYRSLYQRCSKESHAVVSRVECERMCLKYTVNMQTGLLIYDDLDRNTFFLPPPGAQRCT